MKKLFKKELGKKNWIWCLSENIKKKCCATVFPNCFIIRNKIEIIVKPYLFSNSLWVEYVCANVWFPFSLSWSLSPQNDVKPSKNTLYILFWIYYNMYKYQNRFPLCVHSEKSCSHKAAYSMNLFSKCFWFLFWAVFQETWTLTPHTF